ncbi:MAG: hypothetical protein D6702_12005 [Planctomycetota bacterium]|nr:MAG: hypothetical protein D6702_12005 [Planctomycetota bacterium]
MVLLLLGGLLGACACPPEARLLAERPDFRTPEAAARSFLAAVACDDPKAEYRCLAEDLKRETGATLDAWMLGRVEARREIGEFLLGRALRLEHLASTPGEEGVRTVWGLGGRPRLGLLMVPQHYFDLYDAEGPLAGRLLDRPPAAWLKAEDGTLRLEIPGALPRRFPGFAGATRFELGTEWKVRRIEALDSRG